MFVVAVCPREPRPDRARRFADWRCRRKRERRMADTLSRPSAGGVCGGAGGAVQEVVCVARAHAAEAGDGDAEAADLGGHCGWVGCVGRGREGGRSIDKGPVGPV